MGAGLTIQQYEPSPTIGTITTPTGGSWAANTYCFTVFATYARTGSIADVDAIGVDRSSPAAGSNIVVALNDQVVAPFTPGVVGTGGTPEYGTKYCLAYQTAATPTWTNPWTIVAQTSDPLATSLTATSAASLGKITLNASSTVISVTQVLDMRNDEPTPKVRRAYTGKLNRLAQINAAYLRTLSIIIPGGAVTHSEFSRLGKWIGNSTRALIIESEDTDAETDAPIKQYEGIFISTPYLNSLWKNRSPEYPLIFAVEGTTPSGQVP